MSTKFKKSQKVSWKWLGRPVQGFVEDVFPKSVSKTIKGKKITRHGTKVNPAYLVRSEAGNLALKLGSELSVSSKKSTAQSKTKPSMFAG